MERGGLLGIRGAPELKGEEGRGTVDGRIGMCLTKGTLTDRAQPIIPALEYSAASSVIIGTWP